MNSRQNNISFESNKVNPGQDDIN